MKAVHKIASDAQEGIIKSLVRLALGGNRDATAGTILAAAERVLAFVPPEPKADPIDRGTTARDKLVRLVGRLAGVGHDCPTCGHATLASPHVEVQAPKAALPRFTKVGPDRENAVDAEPVVYRKQPQPKRDPRSGIPEETHWSVATAWDAPWNI